MPSLPGILRGRFDFFLVIPAMVLCTLGVLFIYSSGINSSGENISNEYLRQISWIIIGLVVFVIFSITKPYLFKEVAIFAYAIFFLLIILTLVTGRVVNGARSWIGVGELGIQPSEFLKIACILLVAKYLDRWANQIQGIFYFLRISLIFIIPMGAVLLQPDLGTAIVFIPIFLFMIFVSGAQLKHVMYVLLLLILVSFFTLYPAWAEFVNQERQPALVIFKNKTFIIVIMIITAAIIILSFVGWKFLKKLYFYWLMYASSILLLSYGFSIVLSQILKKYQMQRLVVFLDPYTDPKGSGWNIIQSITAVGSGGFNGKGYLQGTQSHYRFLPEQSTDFIFSILSEELGFIGALLVFTCFAFILFRTLFIIKNSKDTFSATTAAGIGGMIFFHVIINIGMATGIMPITGIPLIFISYGGSSLLSAMMALGILSSINSSRYNF